MSRYPSILRSRAPRGVARAVIVLFAVAGLTLTYGAGRSYAITPCTAHDPRPVAAAQLSAGPVHIAAPRDRPDRHGPIGDCGPLAAWIILLTLGLAAPSVRTGRRPPHGCRTPSPPVRSLVHAPSLAFLQVLRL